jgi:hypothetical protein
LLTAMSSASSLPSASGAMFSISSRRARTASIEPSWAGMISLGAAPIATSSSTST